MIDVAFSAFNFKQRLQMIWFILLGRNIVFKPIKQAVHATVEVSHEN